jgi:hypothetical protein
MFRSPSTSFLTPPKTDRSDFRGELKKDTLSEPSDHGSTCVRSEMRDPSVGDITLSDTLSVVSTQRGKTHFSRGAKTHSSANARRFPKKGADGNTNNGDSVSVVTPRQGTHTLRSENEGWGPDMRSVGPRLLAPMTRVCVPLVMATEKGYKKPRGYNMRSLTVKMGLSTNAGMCVEREKAESLS